MKLPKLQPGQYFVRSGGKGLMDDQGNLYTFDPAPTTLRESASDTWPCSKSPRHLPGEVALSAGGYCVAKESTTKRTTPLPSITLSAQTIGYLKAEARWLESQSCEHFVGLSVNGHGEVCGRLDRTDRKPRECSIDIPGVVRECVSQHAQGVICFHNHPRAERYNEALGRHEAGKVEPSKADVAFTDELREALRQANIVLLDHLIVGPRARPHSFTEASSLPETEWDIRQREENRLWAPYGGRPSWAR